MKAVRYYGKEDIRVETVPDPVLLNLRDAIVKVTTTAICGSDLHIYGGFIPTMEQGDILGHEFMGEVVEVGRENTRSPWATASWSRSPSPAAAATSARRTSGRSATTPTRTRGWSRRSAATRARCSAIPHTALPGRAGGACARAVRRRRTDQGARHALGRAGAVLVRHLPTGYMAAENCSIGRTTPLPSGAAARSASSRSRARICSAPRG